MHSKKSSFGCFFYVLGSANRTLFQLRREIISWNRGQTPIFGNISQHRGLTPMLGKTFLPQSRF
jgi:hypothetical protein